MATGRSAMSMRSGFPVPSLKEQRRSRASKQEISSEHLSQQAANRASTSDGCWCEPLAHLTSEHGLAGCRASVIGSARRFIVAMATPIRKECNMHRKAPPRPSEKERDIPPPDQTAHAGAVLVT